MRSQMRRRLLPSSCLDHTNLQNSCKTPDTFFSTITRMMSNCKSCARNLREFVENSRHPETPAHGREGLNCNSCHCFRGIRGIRGWVPNRWFRCGGTSKRKVWDPTFTKMKLKMGIFKTNTLTRSQGTQNGSFLKNDVENGDLQKKYLHPKPKVPKVRP